VPSSGLVAQVKGRSFTCSVDSKSWLKLLLLLLLSVAAADSLPAGPVFHYRIAPPQKSIPSTDNLPVKIRLARQPPGRDGFLPVNCRPREDFSGGDPIIGRLLWCEQYFNKGEAYQFRDYFSRADFL